MACSINREPRGRPEEISCMDVVEGQAPKPQEIVQGAAQDFRDLHGLAKLALHDLVCLWRH